MIAKMLHAHADAHKHNCIHLTQQCVLSVSIIRLSILNTHKPISMSFSSTQDQIHKI